MKKINVNIVVDKKVEVIVDENIWTKEAIKDWSKYFYNATTVKDIAEYALSGILNLSENAHLDGFGYMKVNGSYPYGVKEEQKCTSIEINNFNIDYEVEAI